MVNQASSYFPKGGHSATETEPKIKWTHIDLMWNVTERLTPKKATENHNKTTALEMSVIHHCGGGGGGGGGFN